MARTFGSLFAVAGLLGLVILAVDIDLERSRASIAALAIAALAISAVCFVGYHRLPGWFFMSLLGFGTLMITLAAAGSSAGAEAVYGFFYVWVVFIAFLFYPPRVAAAQAAFAAAAYGLVMFARDTPHAINLLVAGVATIGTTAAVGMLMARVERIATALARRRAPTR